MSVYDLDPVHFFSAPNLSWEAMLITTKVEIELLPDIDMLLFCENAIRGGINGIGALRTFSANNKYMQNYKANEESMFGAFFDVTSLYAGTMEQPLPLGDYVWRSDLTLNDKLSADPFGDIGYMVEIDLHYPSFLHSSHNDLPLAPQKLQINPDWLSSYALSLGLKPSGTAKLVETLFDKVNYVCHFRNLQFYAQQGLEVKTLHKVLQFKQSSWLRKYISKNTSMRKRATSDFEKNFYKLKSNACFGKTMENLRNRRVIKFVVNEMQAKKVTFKPNFKSFNIINQNLVSVHLTNTSILWNKPTPVGASILDLSKLVLYKFHYSEMKPRYGDSLTVICKDTDSLLYRIETDDLYMDMKNFAHLLDLSEYPKNHKLYDPTNKKVPLKKKDELNGLMLEEVVCLRSKLYSIKFSGGVKQSAKGVQRSVKKTLNHDLFQHVLSSGTSIHKKTTQMRSLNHQLVVAQVNKVALSAFDDKRFLLDCGIKSLAYGHSRLQQKCNPFACCFTCSVLFSNYNAEKRLYLASI